MATAFVIGSLAAAAIGLPVDYLRRRITGANSTVPGLVSAAVLIAVVAGLFGAHVPGGAVAIPALVLGLVAGNVAADRRRRPWIRPPPRCSRPLPRSLPAARCWC